MNNRTFQSRGVKFGLILNPKKNNIVNDFEKSFDKIRAKAFLEKYWYGSYKDTKNYRYN